MGQLIPVKGGKSPVDVFWQVFMGDKTLMIYFDIFIDRSPTSLHKDGYPYGITILYDDYNHMGMIKVPIESLVQESDWDVHNPNISLTYDEMVDAMFITICNCTSENKVRSDMENEAMDFSVGIVNGGVYGIEILNVKRQLGLDEPVVNKVPSTVD